MSAYILLDLMEAKESVRHLTKQVKLKDKEIEKLKKEVDRLGSIIANFADGKCFDCSREST